MTIQSIVLAAGQGTRMRSKYAKVLHQILGKPIVWYAVAAAREASGSKPILVVGHQEDDVRQAMGDLVTYVVQEPQLGTGHAVLQTRSELRGGTDLILVTYADMPLLTSQSLRGIIEAQQSHTGPMTMLTIVGGDSRGFGRVVRDDMHNIREIIEEAHATPEQRAIKELNPSIFCFQAGWLWETLDQIHPSPKGEYYLTDTIGIATSQGLHVQAFTIDNNPEMIGINTRIHLAEAETAMRQRINEHWLLAGVTMLDPNTTYIEPEVTIGTDTILESNTVLRGKTSIGKECNLGPNIILLNAQVGDRCKVIASMLENVTIPEGSKIGPFQHHKGR